MDHVEKEHERHDLVLKKLQGARDKWNEDRLERFDFIDKRLSKTNEAQAYINNVDEAILSIFLLSIRRTKK